LIAVVDASALLRLYIPDGPEAAGLEPFLQSVQRGEGVALSPDLLWAEVANVLLRKQKRAELTPEEGSQILSHMLTLPIRTEPHAPLLHLAYQLAGGQGITVYDALYLQVALERGARLFTCDALMRKRAQSLGIA
jgi:predicted nucleic acid-binding protein